MFVWERTDSASQSDTRKTRPGEDARNEQVSPALQHIRVPIISWEREVNHRKQTNGKGMSRVRLRKNGDNVVCLDKVGDTDLLRSREELYEDKTSR